MGKVVSVPEVLEDMLDIIAWLRTSKMEDETKLCILHGLLDGLMDIRKHIDSSTPEIAVKTINKVLSLITDDVIKIQKKDEEDN